MLEIANILQFKVKVNMLRMSGNASKITFTSDPKRAAWRVMHGIPSHVTAEYLGYTGPKNFLFPTNPNLEKHFYPDITKNYDNLVSKIIEEVEGKLGKNKFFNFCKKCNIFLKNFKTADPWDTKFLEDFPGRTKDGKVQYAVLRDRVVNTNFVSNYLYGEVCSKLGIKKRFAAFAAKMDAHGMSNLFLERRLPRLKNIRFKDTPQDQQTIKLVYEELANFNRILT